MYELVFWRYNEGVYLNNHLVYESLVEQETVEGLEELPIALILNRIENVFSQWDKVDANSWKNTTGKGAFQLTTTNQSLKIDCYGVEGKTLNLLTDVLEEFKCPCYDPQVPVRYDDVMQ